MKKGLKLAFALLLILSFISITFAQEEKPVSSVWNHYVFRVKFIQLSRYGAKLKYFSHTGYVRTIYVPAKFINKVFFVKTDSNAPYSYVHAITKNDKVHKITVYLPNIMVQEYTTIDFDKIDKERISRVEEVILKF